MRKLLTLVLFAAITFSANAQVTIRPGVRAGVNFSKFTNVDSQRKTDFFIGGILAMKLAKVYTLQPELSYSRQGGKHVPVTGTVYTQYGPVSRSLGFSEYQLDYVTLGIINKFTFGPGFQVLVGPSLDFKVADNFAATGLDSPQDFDLALVGGVGYAFPNGIAIDLRFKQGLIDIFGTNVYDGSNNNDYYDDNNNGNIDDIILNQSIQLGVSYTFNLGKKK